MAFTLREKKEEREKEGRKEKGKKRTGRGREERGEWSEEKTKDRGYCGQRSLLATEFSQMLPESS